MFLVETVVLSATMAAAMGFAINRSRPNAPDADDPYLEALFRWGNL
jgi:hypothetical protein